MAVKIFTQLTNDDVGVLSSKISEGLFTGGVGELTSGMFHTSSAQVTATGQYNIDVYQAATSSIASEVQFSISYGHVYGSGSTYTNDAKPSKAVYSQYRNLLLEPADVKFSFSGSDANDIVVLNLKRSRFKENIDPGNWQLILSSGSVPNTLSLIDDSGQSLGVDRVPGVTASGKKWYNIVSGSISGGVYTGANARTYGMMYQELGVLVLNADAINLGMGMNSSNTYFLNPSVGIPSGLSNNQRMYNMIYEGHSFKARNEETLNSQHVFVRLKSKEYNFSNNPTYVTGSQGRIIDAINRRGVPFSYVTGIGLYNDKNELLAVAKISKPILKEPGSEALLKIRLDF